VPDKQAEVEAEAFAEVLELGRHQAVTKTDLLEVKQELKTDNQTLRQELKTEIQAVRQELKTEIQAVRHEAKQDNAEIRGDIKVLRWMMSFMLAMMVAIFWLLIRQELRLPA
jgi:capsule polysaccharide export protein KpsE/RkpR